MSIEAKNITKTFGSFVALNDVSIQFPSGQLVALLGPSGSGKTTLLRIIAGLETANAGSIYFEGEDATQRNARDRRVGFVFQHYALFRHMTVFDNIAFGLKVKPRRERPTRDDIKDRVFNLLKLVQLDMLAYRYPSQLSGGQRQRVALARALAVEPKVLLLDEPFGALDAKVRKELRRWLRRLHDEIHVTSIFVTHDVEEALEVADQVVVMNQGKIEQIGTPEEVYDHPASPFVYDFLGTVNEFSMPVHQNQTSPDQAALPHKNGRIMARPHELDVARNPLTEPSIAASIIDVHNVGSQSRVTLRRLDNGDILEAELTRELQKELNLKRDEQVFVRPRNMKVYVEDYTI